MTKKILITGGAGFIGFHLAKKLQKTGYDICLLDNFSRGTLDEEFSKLKKLKNLKLINLDCRDKKKLLDIDFHPNIIFHLAAIIGVQNVNQQPYNVLVDNIKMLENIIEFSKSKKKFERLLFASTSEVYAGTLENFELTIPTEEKSPLTITNLLRPRTSYMLSKIYGEAMCIHSNLPYTIFRPHNVYGPRMGMSHVIPQQLEKAFFANDGDKIEVPSSNQTRSFCYIDDAVTMLNLIMEENNCINKVLNLGIEEDEIKISEVVQICWETVNKKISPVFLPPTEGSPNRRAPDMKQLKSILVDFKHTNLKDGVSRTYAWYLKNIFNSKNTGQCK